MDKKYNSDLNAKRLVLVVDDEYVNRELLGFILKKEYEVLYAENGKQALELIKENRRLLSLVLLDLMMPEMNGFELLEIMREDEELRRIPIIVLTSEEAAETRSLRLGAADFIKKPYNMPEVILARVSRIIELSEGRFIIRSAERDTLTGLYTKGLFFEYCNMNKKYHPDRQMDALVLNIDRFHLINEIYGRPKGDEALKLIASALTELIHDEGGIGCRSEADNFLIYCAHRPDYDRFLERISDVLLSLSGAVHIKLRLGVYQNTDSGLDIEQCFDRAKSACDTIRNNYTKTIAFYDDTLHKKDIYYERLINDMQASLENRHFRVFYQPKYGITGEMAVLRSAEALIRWEHPELGMISPGDFVPLFEANGLIQLLDHYVWREAARQVKEWRDSFGITIPVSVNVSRIDIYDPDIESILLGIIEENGLTTKDILLEVTESAYSDNAKQLLDVIHKLRSHGFRIEMDDFGSGYSSLNMLTELPIDVLKLDMLFVRNMHREQKSRRLVELIMEIAKYLSVPVVAEGVEEEEQYRLLKQMGCEVIQGYYFSKPVPALEFENFIKAAASEKKSA